MLKSIIKTKWNTLLLSMILFLSCNKTDNTVDYSGVSSYRSNCNYQLSAKDFQFFGEAHNRGLDYVYHTYLSNLDSLPKNYQTSKLEYVVLQYVNENYKETSILPPISNIITNFSDSEKQSILSLIFSSEQLSILNNIDSVFNCREPEEALARLEEIDKTINEMQNDDYKAVLWSSVAVARHSIYYWTTDEGADFIDKIVTLKKSNLINPKFKSNQHNSGIDWKEVAYADYNGFISGLIHYGASGIWKKDLLVGAISGALSTEGIGAVPGAIIGVVGGAAKFGIGHAVAYSAGNIAWQTFM